MPHRVANFFRSSTNSLEKRTVVTSSRRKESPSRVARGSGSSERLACTSAIEVSADDARYAQRPKMGESRSTSSAAESHKEHAHHHHHKISFPSMHFGRSSKDAHGSSPCVLDWKLESPPIVLYGDAERSSGALVSGQLILNIKEDKVEVTSFDATLGIHVTHKKPFANHCHECAHEVTELKRWQILPNPLTLTKGEHYFPFSVLLEGHLPATMDGPLSTIAYEFKSEAITKSGNSSYSSRLEKVLDVKRSLAGSDVPHHSVRVFPPTNIKASGHYPHVIHPIGSFTLSLRLDGISQHNAKVGTIEYWKLKKLTWRLEETSKTVAPACIRHVPREIDGASQDQGQKKGIPRTETRTIGEKTMFSGWKSNYMSTTDSSIELELEYSLGKHAKYVCDTKSRDGTEVTHQLMVELVVSQEWAPINRPTLVTHTGVGRILRMHFGTVLTERAGIGISWDNEAPPIYQDVPPSPPAYSQATVEDSECSLDEMMEELGLDSPVQAMQPQSPGT